MFSIVELLFGNVFANKLRLIVGDKKQIPLVVVLREVYAAYLRKFKTGNDAMKFYLVVAILLNGFMFSGLLSFLMVMFADFVLFRIISK